MWGAMRVVDWFARESAFRDAALMRRILWSDVSASASTAILGLLFTGLFSKLFALSQTLLVIISLITFGYMLFGFSLVIRKALSLKGVRALVIANWAWAAASVVLTCLHAPGATLLGQAFLILQILVVGGFAYVEGAQIVGPAAEKRGGF